VPRAASRHGVAGESRHLRTTPLSALSGRDSIYGLPVPGALLVFAPVNEEPLISLFFAAAAEGVSRTNAPTGGKFALSREEVFQLAKDYGPKALGAILILIAGLFVARWVGKLVSGALNRRDMEPPVRLLMVRLAKLVVVLLALLMAIQQLGFQLLPLVAGLSVAGVGVGLAMQGVLSNLVAGLTIIFVKKFRVGEYIEINGVQGQVEMIELFSTTLIHPDRSRILIPNRKIVGEIIHNYGIIRQANLSVGVGYDTDLNRALEIINDILRTNPRVLKDPAPGVGTSALADSSIVIAIKPWTALADFGAAQAEINKAVIERFREAEIQIPFPQREVRLVSSPELKSAA
jgi:small conductance mechanosensitive channel